MSCPDLLTGSPQWKRISALWRETEEICSAPGGVPCLDEKGRSRILQAVDLAVGDVRSLRQAGLVDAEEAHLLTQDLASLRKGMEASLSGPRPAARSAVAAWR